MWERITAGLASLGDRAVGEGSSGSAPLQQSMGEEQLVEYEGMLVAASAAERRRWLSPSANSRCHAQVLVQSFDAEMGIGGWTRSLGVTVVLALSCQDLHR